MLHKRFADNTNAGSVAARLRRQRFALFAALVDSLPGVVSVLDIGGTQQYWQSMAPEAALLRRVRVTLLNLEPQAVSAPNFTSLVGDARAMPQFADRQFDLVFSNSTIEHLGSSAAQQAMAAEVRRVGQGFYIQTPNRYFPLEPHFLFPGFQFLPLGVRAWLVRHFKLGWFPRIVDRRQARAEVAAIRLLGETEFRALFPGAAIYKERYCGLTKSFVAYTPVAARLG
jgi:SAM-dependent methyltransferase